MKRKVKFQEGGVVETPGQRRARLADSARTRSLEFFDDLRRRNQAAAAEREASRRLYEERARAQQMPTGRQDFTTDPQGTTRRGAATGREVVPFDEGRPPRTTARQALDRVATPRQIPLGRVRPPVGGNLATLGGGVAMGLAEPLVNYGRDYAARRGAEADARREANLQAFRDQQQERMTMEQELGEAAQRMPTPRPRPAARPAAPARRELTAEELNALVSGERAPRTSEERALLEGLRSMPQLRQRAAEAEEAPRPARARDEDMGGSGNIGAASARERGEQVGPPGQYNMKKGGKVPKPVAKKAGGMIAKPKASPKKMMKGGVVAKPKVAAKSKAKPMPFKKGGVIKKGRK